MLDKMRLRARFKRQIILWLGAAYDSRGVLKSNPDYYDKDDVNNLVESLLEEVFKWRLS
jgi:hypothetical protein